MIRNSSPSFTRRAFVAAAAAACLGLGMSAAAQSSSLTGAGASFPFPIYSKWFAEYKKVDGSVSINYQSVGSGGGQKQILEQTVDFGASDGPVSDENLGKAKGGKLLHIPTVAGAVVLTFNVEGVTALKLDGPTVADIFLGKVKKWNDPAIAGQNPQTKLPDAEIVVVHRADGSGTSYIFTDFLSAVSPEWKAKVGTNTAVSWPTGLGGKGNEGVTSQVKQNANSIGYVELIFARQQKLPVADMKNSAGKYVTPSLESVTAAIGAAQIPDDFRFSIVNPPGEGAYPISGVTWLLVYEQIKKDDKDPNKGKKLVDFLKWALGDGQKYAKQLDYSPLPEALQKRVLDRVATIKY